MIRHQYAGQKYRCDERAFQDSHFALEGGIRTAQAKVRKAFLSLDYACNIEPR